jgi:uncharacterized membrane protein
MNMIYTEKAEKAAKGYHFSIEHYLSEGYAIFRRGAAELIIYGILNVIVLSLPFVRIFLSGPMTAGFYEGIYRIKSRKETEVRDFFKAFDKFLPMVLVNLVVSLLVVVGLILLILPGFYFYIIFIFAYQFVYFADASVGESLSLSRKAVSGNFGQMMLLCLVLFGINLLGGIAFLVGLLLTIPYTYCVIFVAFDDIIGVAE